MPDGDAPNPYQSPQTETNQGDGRPFWVNVGLWGLSSRASAWLCFWLSMAIAAGSIAYGFLNPRFFVGGTMVLAALWYYLAIRWVDQYGRWPSGGH
jgi:hypothetical protein